MTSCTKHKIVVWSPQIVCAAILGQTLFFKFSGAEESRYIFATLGVEPWGRYLTGGAELLAVASSVWRVCSDPPWSRVFAGGGTGGGSSLEWLWPLHLCYGSCCVFHRPQPGNG